MYGKIALSGLALLLSSCAATVPKETDKPAAQIPIDQQAFLDTCEPWDEWDKPAPPFKVYGNTYYVGTCGIAAILIAGDDQHILIDTGTDEGAKIVLANIRSLGFEPSDVSTIMISHEHFDHVGGIARIQRVTGATIVSSEIAAASLMSGSPSASDPQADSGHPVFEPVTKPITKVFPDNPAAVGPNKIRPIFTPGHSPGALSWQWQTCAGDQCLSIVYADSLSPISSDDYRYSDHPNYLASYREGLALLAQQDCDILLSPHPSHSKMIQRAASGTLIGGVTCAQYAEGKLKDIEKRLAKEAERK